MLKVILGLRPNGRRLRCRVYPGQKVSRKYRRAIVRRVECRRLQRLIPTISTRKRVPELTVILEAVKYIDELHSSIADRVRTLQGRQLPLPIDRKRAMPTGSDATRPSIIDDAALQEPTQTDRFPQRSQGGATGLSGLFPHPAVVLASHLKRCRHLSNKSAITEIQGTSAAKLMTSSSLYSSSKPHDFNLKSVLQRDLPINYLPLSTNAVRSE